MHGLNRLLVASLMALSSHGASAENTPLGEDDCRAVWNTAAGRSDLSEDGAKPYIDDFPAADTNHDRKISNAEFKAACKAGLVHKFRASP